MSVVRCRAHRAHTLDHEWSLLLKFHPAIIKWHSARRQRRTIFIAIFLHSIKCTRHIVKSISFDCLNKCVCGCVVTEDKCYPHDCGMGLFPPSIEIENLCSWFCIWHRNPYAHALSSILITEMNRTWGHSCREGTMWHFVEVTVSVSSQCEWRLKLA